MTKTGILYLSGKTYVEKGKKCYLCFSENTKETMKVAYNLKQKFSKSLMDKYVLLNDDNTLLEVIGDVNIYDNYLRYELEKCNIAKKNKTHLEKIIQNPIVCCKNENIFTVDGETTRDFDDAISFRREGDNYIVSVYISNVPIMLDLLKFWDIKNISSVYLPTMTKNMLPDNLAENFCSLKEGTIRETFCMELFIMRNDFQNEILEINFSRKNVFIRKNYIYESKELENDIDYMYLINLIRGLDDNNKKINDSYNLIEWLMVKMNHECAKFLESNQAIFRNCKRGIAPIENLDFWYGNTGNYSSTCEKHEMLNLHEYLHITSPIRRVVDIVNLISIQQKLGLYNFSNEAIDFCRRNIYDVENLDKKTKEIKYLQNRVSIVHMLLSSESLLQTTGYLFDEEQSDNMWKYKVYMDKKKLVYKIKSVSQLDMTKKYEFNIHLFMNESRNKIKIEIVMDGKNCL